ncbi:MAG: permease-like cell division protein FtsX [Candidatus Nomurabacteria bacterium]|jgi:cell division transport system permease protein|nr:permease-like cell division protein FtsX [Candidatus Nomurabacteria bacterium]
MSKQKSEVEIRSKSNLKRMTKARKHRSRTTARVLKYGTQSFARNTWLTVAAIAIMTITLLVMSATLIVTSAMGTAIDMVREQVDMSIYIKQESTRSEVDEMVGRLSQLPSVRGVRIVSYEEAFIESTEKMISENNITDEDVIEEMMMAPNKFPWTLNVKIADLNDPSELEYFVNNDESMRGKLDVKPPSFASSHRETIDNIAATMNAIKMGGLIAAGVFAVIAILVVFNTVRMAIFNRKEEIQMMKLIGASKGFVRGPFVVEAMLYGVVAAGISGVLVGVGVSFLDGKFGGTLTPTVAFIREWWILLAAGLLVGGMLLGIFSALLATKKYLKMK